MSEIRHRVAVHRSDALILLEELTRTARLHKGFRLAGAVGHIARAQVLLAEELDELPGGSEQEPASSESSREVPEDDTPADGIRLTTSKPD